VVGGELPELPLNVAQVSFMTRTECSPFLGLTGGALVAMTIPPFLVSFSSPTDTFFAFFVALKHFLYVIPLPHSVRTTVSFSKTQQKGIRDFAWKTCPRFCNCLFHASHGAIYHSTFTSLHTLNGILSHTISPSLDRLKLYFSEPSSFVRNRVAHTVESVHHANHVS
jgi:hypothetical protein